MVNRIIINLQRRQKRAKVGLFSTGDWVLSETPLEKTAKKSQTEEKKPKKPNVRKSNKNDQKTVDSPMTGEQSSVSHTLLNTNIPNTVEEYVVVAARTQKQSYDHYLAVAAAIE